MTGLEIKALNNTILSRPLDDTTFYSLALLAQDKFEGERPWRQLLARNTANSNTSGAIYTTAYTLPTDFRMFSRRKPIVLVSGNERVFLDERPLEDLEEIKDQNGFVVVDLANNCYYLTGTQPKAYSHTLNYTKRSTAISENTSWVFPSVYHAYIAFEVAVMEQLGIDYDDVNARQGDPNAKRADMILASAVKWDAALWVNASQT